MKSLEELSARRASLRAQAQREREAIARDFDPLGRSMQLFDRGYATVRWVRDRPLLWLRVALVAWQLWRLVRR